MADFDKRAAGILEPFFNDFVMRSYVEHIVGEDICYAVSVSHTDKDPLWIDRQLAAFRIELSGLDVEELGYSEYPKTGRDEGYSYAMIIGPADEDKTELIRQAFQRSIDTTNFSDEI